MFSVQNLNHSFHNQQAILFHLTNLTPRINKKCVKHQNSSETKSRKINQIEKSAYITCKSDLLEIITKEFRDSIEYNRNFTFNVDLNKSNKSFNKTSSVAWNPTQYVSTGSFETNKNISYCSDRQQSNYFTNSSLKHINRFDINLFDIQKRTFKTYRALISENQRNPTILSRLKEAYNQPATSGGKRLETLNQTSQTKQTIQHESLSKLLNQVDTNLTTEQKHQLKLAFAEGYLAANHPDNAEKGGKAMKYLKIIQQLLMIIIITAIMASLFTSNNGSVFSNFDNRIQLGTNVEIDPEDISVSFDDVKGCDEAKQELKEVVEFLKNPEKFSNLGGKLPKGVLLVGPPGTGKTLLARAVAGEAGVPFFHAAGPEFDEVLVGQGARRVRDLFKAAKERAPCVIFIDEIDSVGAKRTNSVLHPYANQTINQLLSEMDGFQQNEGVIVLGATNRREDLDQALLRPGRFDVEVNVPTPDFTGRKEIITHYLGKILSKDINVDMLARGTTGFTGADIENMVNQAALKAAIEGAEVVTMRHLENARDKVLMGPERKARIPDEEANKITAYHEGGHAIVAYFTKESHPLHKVTIMPRGPSLGHTAYIPEKERYHVTKTQLMAMLDTMLGGRAAEELIFGADKITSGASSDLKQATSIASHMVKDWGMSEKVGLRTIEGARGLQSSENLSATTIESVDSEIKKILSDSYDRAKAILKAHSKEHKALAEALLKYETLDAEDIKAILAGDKINIESSH
ncbi:ATP-dependent zinc metalloprotease YME1L isoform X2 [Chironomus tepperi]|uniref:ATP-dependent zinc metalloprotease YME1L isoform X2 n=1 Tax=Chironomus tepperi TaxID=113505 RepID=UPI00391FB392